MTKANPFALAVGIPMIVSGARKVPPPGATTAWHGAPGGAGWQWKF